MPADEKVQRVMTRIGVWKPDVKCKLPCGDSDHYGRSSGNLWGHQQPRSNPCPDPSDPAMIVAMLEWIIRSGYISFTPLVNGEIYWEHRSGHARTKTLTEAIIDAIDALPED